MERERTAEKPLFTVEQYVAQMSAEALVQEKRRLLSEISDREYLVNTINGTMKERGLDVDILY